MEDLLIEILEEFGFPVHRQGSLAPDEPYPETFFTFWNRDTYEVNAYDNETFSEASDFDVNVYSTDPDMVYELLREARKNFKKRGWVCPSHGYDVASDEETHTGRGMNVINLQGGI